VRHKTLITLAAAVALGCASLATNALAAGHPGGHGGGHGGGRAAAGHAMAGHARGGGGGGHVARYGGGRGARYGGGYGYSSGPIYDSCDGYGPGYGPGYGYGYNGCRGYGIPLVGGVINGILGGGF
jgi:hypothetical protein